MSFALGKGFDSLIPTDLIDDEFDPTADTDAKTSELKEIPLEKISRDESQPRKHFSDASLKELAESIKEHGVLQPIVVVKLESGKYQIVAGERRFRAAKLAELEKIPAIIRTLDAQNKLELSIIENAQREDLNAIELATAYAKLKTQFNLTSKEIARRIGKNESTVINTMRLLNLPEDAKKAMLEHHLSEGVMRPLITADPETVAAAVPLIIAEGWSARRVEQFIASRRKRSSATAIKNDTYKKQEVSLTAKYGFRVRIAPRSVTFSCKNEEELKTLLQKLK